MFFIFPLTFWRQVHIIVLTEPDTPLYDADHVGSFDFLGEKYEEKTTSTCM